MVARLKDLFSRSFTGLHQAALILALSALASQVLALVRDRIFAHMFGAGQTLDVYYAAFRIPDLLFVTIASLVSMTVLIPYFTREFAKDKAEAHVFLNSVFTVYMTVLTIATVAAFFLIVPLSKYLTLGFSDLARDQYITLSRILLLSPFFLGVSYHVASINQSFKKFTAYALSPIFYNVGIIIGSLVLFDLWGIDGLAWGVVLGSFLHFAVQWPTVKQTGFAPRFVTRPNFAKVYEVLVVSIPRTLALGSTQIAGVVLTSFASLLAVGSISVYNFSFTLQSVPFAVIGVSYSMAAFPTLSALFSSGARDKFVSHMVVAARQIIFWSLPVTVLFIVLRAQIVRTILGSGNFDWTATRLVAASFAIFALSLIAQSLTFLFVRGYYASGSTRTPLYSNILSAVLIIVLVPILLGLYQGVPMFEYFFNSLLRVEGVPGTSVLMLPLAYTLGLFVNLGAHWMLFVRDFPGFISLFNRTVRQSFYSAIMAGFVAFGGLNLFDNVFDIDTTIGIFMQGLCAGLGGIVAGVLLLYVLRNEELIAIRVALKSKIWGSRPILPAPEDSVEI